jgi:hypothetical protein
VCTFKKGEVVAAATINAENGNYNHRLQMIWSDEYRTDVRLEDRARSTS